MITWVKKENNFQIQIVQLQGVAWFLLDFLQFQPEVAYKSVAYIKIECSETLRKIFYRIMCLRVLLFCNYSVKYFSSPPADFLTFWNSRFALTFLTCICCIAVQFAWQSFLHTFCATVHSLEYAVLLSHLRWIQSLAFSQ